MWLGNNLIKGFGVCDSWMYSLKSAEVRKRGGGIWERSMEDTLAY